MTNINNEQSVKKILNGETVSFTFRFFDEEFDIKINSIILKVLSAQGNLFLFEIVTTVVRELLFNAFKANIKRIYFQKHNADINNKREYEALIKNFKEEILFKLDSIESEVKANADYYITISFKKEGDMLDISVFNNVRLTEEEYERIMLRLQQYTLAHNLAEAYDDSYNSQEGAGLGFMIIMFLLKNSGIGDDNLSIENNHDGITVGVKIPRRLNDETTLSDLKEKILNDVDSLPTFTENIVKLQKLCLEKESTIDEISKKISMDPALTADVIKLSNSAGFSPGKKIVTAHEAVKIIGLKNLYFVLTASATKRILENKYKRFEIIWQHCVKVAYYAKHIAEMMSLLDIEDHAFIAGLLHDIGKIVLLAANEKVIDKMSGIIDKDRLRSSSVLEETTVGISHTEIGGLIAEKWNFPDELKIPIANHHNPLISHDDFKILTYMVYLANMLCGVESKKYNYNYIETTVLNYFKLNTEYKLKSFHDKIRANYNDHQSVIGFIDV